MSAVDHRNGPTAAGPDRRVPFLWTGQTAGSTISRCPGYLVGISPVEELANSVAQPKGRQDGDAPPAAAEDLISRYDPGQVGGSALRLYPRPRPPQGVVLLPGSSCGCLPSILRIASCVTGATVGGCRYEMLLDRLHALRVVR